MKTITRCALLLILLFAATADADAHGEPAPRPETSESNIGYPNVAAARKALLAKPGIEVMKQNEWVVINDATGPDLTIWHFTPEAHEAHPAAVRRTTLEKDGYLHLKMDVHCEAAKPDCTALLVEFRKINDRIREQMKQ